VKVIYTEDADLLRGNLLFPITPEWMLERAAPLLERDVWMDGLITSEIVDLIQEHLKKNYSELLAKKPYDLEVLSRVRDFRTLVNLSYVVHLSRRMGVSTSLDPVLSFPLGGNSISIAEAALVYQTIVTGNVYPLLPQDKSLTMVPVITRIVDREDEILWEYKPRPQKIMTSRVSALVTEILGKVMEVGTGREAKDSVQLIFGEDEAKIGVPIPSFGKTGTANRFTNSSFVGFIPGPNKKTGDLGIQDGYVIASYVGYDNNRPMKSKHFSIYGASGALPLWINTANAIVNAHDFRDNLQPADLAFNPVSSAVPSHDALKTVPVSPVTGLPLKVSNEAPEYSHLPTIQADVQDRGEYWELKRHFEPL
jgi:membrane peptidoglycan carboxypeptidase